MKKRIATAIISAIMVSSLATTAMASSENRMVITHPEDGVTEGYVDEIVDWHNMQRDTYVDYVGIGSDDIGPWEHGVVLSGLSGTVYSNYTNPKYWHGSSAKGTGGTVKSALVRAGVKSTASVKTTVWDGNRAFWRVDEKKV